MGNENNRSNHRVGSQNSKPMISSDDITPELFLFKLNEKWNEASQLVDEIKLVGLGTVKPSSKLVEFMASLVVMEVAYRWELNNTDETSLKT